MKQVNHLNLWGVYKYELLFIQNISPTLIG